LTITNKEISKISGVSEVTLSRYKNSKEDKYQKHFETLQLGAYLLKMDLSLRDIKNCIKLKNV
jgi:DNA-binding transcriptional MerR regulator